MFKKFILRCSVLVIILLFSICPTYYQDTFNVFHWNNIRFTSAEPNKNFVKTKYIISNPHKFNAFIFGSSRVGNLPKNQLPKEYEKNSLRWYNMTYSEGTPGENYMTVKTFIENGVDIKFLIIGFDNIYMYSKKIEDHKKQLMRIPYQSYIENKLNFYLKYLKEPINTSIFKEILSYDNQLHLTDSFLFYDYGTENHISDFSLTDNPKKEKYKSAHEKGKYTEKNSFKEIKDLSEICKEHNIKLILFTNPLYESTYKDAVEEGYLDLLKCIAQNYEFYNFSSLNSFTTNPAYYFESSHYRPALGLIIEKMLFGIPEEKEQIRKEANDTLWGTKLNSENVDFVIQELEKQVGF